MDSLHITGPDKLHPRILKEIAKEISLPLSIIYNNSFITGNIPQQWRFASITALFKNGDRKFAGNYRPVSLTCILCKVMENIV